VTTIDLATGVPDIRSPQQAADAAIAAIERGETTYVGAAGIAPLREAITQVLLRERGLSYVPEQVMVTAGAKLSLYCVLSVLVTPGSEVVLPVPHYGGYRGQVERLGGRLVAINTTPDVGYKLTPDQLRDALSPRTSVVLLNSPANPSGAVYSRDELTDLAGVVLRHSSAMVVSDEIYARFVYDDERAPSFGALGPEALSRTVTIDGVSKAYGMTGWRIGYAAGPIEVMNAARAVHTGLCNCAPSVSQWAALGALTAAPVDHHDQQRHQELRDAAHQAVSRWHGIATVKPAGAIYQLVELVPDELGIDPGDEPDFFRSWEARADVKLAHASRFGRPSVGRLTFSVPRRQLQDGLDRLALALKELAADNRSMTLKGTVA
jgi:aspartate aminotransferase